MQIKESIIFVSLIPHYFLGKYNSSNASYFFLLVLQSPSNSRGIRFQALHIMIKYDKKSHKYNYASWGSSSTWKMSFDNFKCYRIWIEELYWITRYWRIIDEQLKSVWYTRFYSKDMYSPFVSNVIVLMLVISKTVLFLDNWSLIAIKGCKFNIRLHILHWKTALQSHMKRIWQLSN